MIVDIASITGLVPHNCAFDPVFSKYLAEMNGPFFAASICYGIAKMVPSADGRSRLQMFYFTIMGSAVHMEWVDGLCQAIKGLECAELTDIKVFNAATHQPVKINY